MIYKGQKLSDNLTQSQRDMFKYMIDNGHSVDDIVKMYLGNVKDTFFRLDEEGYFRKKAEPYVEE
jgi:hypothetical protein